MTEKEEQELNKLTRPTDNPDEAQNDMNYMQKVDIIAYLQYRRGEITEEEYQIIKDQTIRQAPRLIILRDNLNNLEG